MSNNSDRALKINHAGCITFFFKYTIVAMFKKYVAFWDTYLLKFLVKYYLFKVQKPKKFFVKKKL